MSSTPRKTMTTAEIRSSFLDFFASKGSKLYPSSSLVPDDPSLLLTNAGMNQFKEYYQGIKTMPHIGAHSCQKCLRTNDIDVIGDARHLSFFEMLGNFSFGGYSKADAIAWAWEYCTSPEYLGLPADKLYFTVFTDDDEAAELWQQVGADPSHISRLGEDDNFWAAGPTGPCGPCSEIYYDQGEEFGCGRPDCAPGCDCDRYLEFWNLVFTQYDRQEDGSMPELPHKNIDTGMGLERIAAIMQGEHSNYEGDVMRSLISLGEQLSGKSYGADETSSRSLRIVADHSRAITFMIGDGILPSNEGRGYVLRRLLRRAVYHGRLLGIEGTFLENYSVEVMRLMATSYPELSENKALILGILNAEEDHFRATLDAGEQQLSRALDNLDEGTELAGELAFTLHDTYGFPIDLTREICETRGVSLDMAGFERCMNEQRERARASANRDAWGSFNDVWVALSDVLSPTEFLGYEHTRVEDACVMSIVMAGAEVAHASEGSEVEVVLDKTPFYAEKGGQVGDTGVLRGQGVEVEIFDTQLREGDLIAHIGKVSSGTLGASVRLAAEIDTERRALIRRNHTATHLLDAALKEVLGEHVSQAGSLVAPDRLRFDFTHFEATTSEQLEHIEELVNREIAAAKPVVVAEMGIDEAKAAGAIALFGEKYGDIVRVVSVGEEETPFSRELCGGTHVANSSEIGLFKIISESSVGSNARRIEAVTSTGALSYVNERLQIVDELAAQLRCRPEDLPNRLEALQTQRREAEQKLKAALTGGASSAVADAIAGARKLEGYSCVIARLDGMGPGELRQTWDSIRDKLGAACACVLASSDESGKVALLAAGTDAAVEAGFAAGKLVGSIAEKVGGRGGGRPNMAQAGGKDASGIDEALAQARTILGA